MASYLVLTATGRDRPGVVDSVTEKIVAYDGNVELSRMARLGGEFAMLALITIAPERVDAMLGSLRELEDGGLFVRVRKTDPTKAHELDDHLPLDVKVTGADHRGIIHQVAHELAKRQVNIETMDTNVSAAPMSGAPLFTMRALVLAPPETLIEELAAALEQIGIDLGVDIDIDPHNLD